MARPRKEQELDIARRAVEETIRLLAVRGDFDVPLSEVAQAVGCTAPALYSHFRNKNALLRAARDEGFRRLYKEKLAVPGEMRADPIGYLYSDGVSMQTDGQPGSYANSLTVASVDNDGFIGNYLLIGQDPIAPSETTGFTNKLISTIVGEHEFVFFSEDATKYAVDAAGNNLLLAYADAVKDKIVFVSRGQSSFYQKHDAAAAAGAGP